MALCEVAISHLGECLPREGESSLLTLAWAFPATLGVGAIGLLFPAKIGLPVIWGPLPAEGAPIFDCSPFHFWASLLKGLKP